MITLTAEDHATIERIIFGPPEPTEMSYAEQAYRAGMAAMAERCVKACEGTVTRPCGYGGQWEGYGPVKTERTGSECAAAIRALLNPKLTLIRR